MAPVSTASNVASGALFDPEALRGLFGADPGRLSGVLQSFAEGAARDIAAMRSAPDAQQIASSAHRLNGAARMAGARLLAEQAARAEAAGNRGDLELARSTADEMDRLLTRHCGSCAQSDEGTNMYPRPRTLRITSGFVGSRSTLRRRRITRLSMARSNDSASRWAIVSNSQSRESGRFGCSTKMRSKSNSLAASSEDVPSARTRTRRSISSTAIPIRTSVSLGASSEVGLARLSTAFTRATNSRVSNGLAT